MRRVFIVFITLLSWEFSARADDWPQWTGPRRDSIWRESRVLAKFPATGPKVLWRTPVAGGYSGPAVSDGRVFVSDYLRADGEFKNDPGIRPKLQGRERIWCLDVENGTPIWKQEYDCAYEISYPAGPRATPTVDGDRVYMQGAEGRLTCFESTTGKTVWSLDLQKQYQATTPMWGYVSHPLVDGDLLFCMAGGPGSVAVALDKYTGQERWRALTAKDAGYCPPTMIEFDGRRELVIWHPQSINGLEPNTGRVLWTTDLVPDYGMSINPPRQSNEYLFVGGIYNKAVLLRLAKGAPGVEEVWRASNEIGIGPVHSPPILEGTVMYGVDREGELTAIDLPTGRRLWRTYAATTGTRRASSGTGFIVRNDDRAFIFGETGTLVLARLTPEKYEELDRAKILEPNHEAFGRNVVWSHPAFANRCMFVRNDKEIVCVSLAE